jgi:5'-nucleotidase
MAKSDNLCILISNDDGIHAPGIKVLEKVARELTDDVWIVAPDQEQSGAAHSLTLHYPLRAKKLKEKKYAVYGTPTDCVLMAIEELMEGKKPDLVLSGINNGANLGDDVTYSGTVAAAMEATLMKVPAIALSLANKISQPNKWQTAEDHAPGIIKKLIECGWPKDVLINVNFPDIESKKVKGVKVCKMGFRPPYKSIIKSLDPRGNPYYWFGAIPEHLENEENTDLAAISENMISVTPLHLDLTHSKTLSHLQKHLG